MNPATEKLVCFQCKRFKPATVTVSLTITHAAKVEDAHQDPYVAYTVRVQVGGYAWDVVKRYREFAALHTNIVKYINKLPVKCQPPALPSTGGGLLANGFDPVFVSKRRAALQKFLSAVSRCTPLVHGGPLCAFAVCASIDSLFSPLLFSVQQYYSMLQSAYRASEKRVHAHKQRVRAVEKKRTKLLNKLAIAEKERNKAETAKLALAYDNHQLGEKIALLKRSATATAH